MREHERTLRDDVAFLRALAEGGPSGAVREGAILIAIGLIFGLVAVQYWAVDSALIHVSQTARTWLWLDGGVPFLVSVAVISAKCPARSPGAASRALAAAWSGVGAAFIVSVLGLVAASWEIGIPLLVKWMFPLILFTLIGAAWGVAFAVRRQRVFGLAAAGSYAAAILCGSMMGRPQEWLVLSGGLIILIAAPGGAILRAAARPQ